MEYYIDVFVNFIQFSMVYLN